MAIKLWHGPERNGVEALSTSKLFHGRERNGVRSSAGIKNVSPSLAKRGFEAGPASKILHGSERNGVRSHSSIKVVAWSLAKRGSTIICFITIGHGPCRNGVRGSLGMETGCPQIATSFVFITNDYSRSQDVEMLGFPKKMKPKTIKILLCGLKQFDRKSKNQANSISRD